MVTWGANTVHTFGSTGSSQAPAPAPTTGQTGFGFGSSPAPAPAFGSFGAPSPAPSGGLFGGSSAPAPSSGGLFGSSPAPAPGTSNAFSFGGSSAPSPAPSLFGSAPSSGGLFGAPAPSSGGLFGSTAPSPAPFGGFGGGGFGSQTQQQQQQQQQQPQIPAQAAMHAHMEAQNRQETERIKAALTKLHAAYSGNATPEYSSDKAKFCSIVYNDLTQDQRQQQWLHGISTGGTIMPIAPPRPPQISEEEWNRAVVQNPDPLSYMPIPLIGAESLNARVSWQQERATELAKHAEAIKGSHEAIQEAYKRSFYQLEDVKRKHANQRKRLLNVMRKVEIVRCMNQPLQQDEVRVMTRLRDLNEHTNEVRKHLAALENSTRTTRPQQQHHHGALTRQIELPDREKLHKVLTEHHNKLAKLSLQMQKDVRDVKLMKERVLPPSRPYLLEN